MIGDRVRQARLAAGLTLDDVARRLTEQGASITRAGLSKYELNKSTPAASFLLKLANILAVPSSYFLEEPPVVVSWIAFRQHTRLRSRQQAQIRAYATRVAESQVWLQSKLYPSETPGLITRPAESFDDAEATAMKLRQDWKLGDAPIESVTQSAEAHGVVVVRWQSHHGQFDGLVGWINERIPIVVAGNGVSEDRWRYNLAHELGHLILEPVGPMAEHEEALAHRFAGAFLAPASAVRRELGTRRRHLSLQELGLLKRKYGLSMQAWSRRAYNLQIIDEGHFNSLCRELSRRRWRKEEPISFHGSENPIRLQQLTLHALAEGMISETQAERFCPDGIALDGLLVPLPQSRTSAADLLTLPTAERSSRLAAAAVAAAEDYRDNVELTDFEAFGANDLYDDPDAG